MRRNFVIQEFTTGLTSIIGNNLFLFFPCRLHNILSHWKFPGTLFLSKTVTDIGILHRICPFCISQIIWTLIFLLIKQRRLKLNSEICDLWEISKPSRNCLLRTYRYTTTALERHGAHYFLKRVKIPQGATLDLILLDTGPLQVCCCFLALCNLQICIRGKSMVFVLPSITLCF